MTDSNPTKDLVPRSECEKILRYLDEACGNVPGLRHYLHILRAFYTCGGRDPGCVLSEAQYIEYCQQHGLAETLGKWRYSYLQRLSSQLSQRLLHPAAYKLGLAKYISISFTEINKHAFTAVLRYRDNQRLPAFIRSSGFDSLDDLEWLPLVSECVKNNYTLTSRAKKKIDAAKKTASMAVEGTKPRKAGQVVSFYDEGDGRTTKRHRPPKSRYSESLARVDRPVKTQKWLMTRLDCIISVPGKRDGNFSDQVLETYEDICQKTVRHFGGTCTNIFDGHTTSYFGQSPAFSTHARAAIDAALQMAQSFQRLKRLQNDQWRTPDIYLLVHTFEGMVSDSEKEGLPKIHSTLPRGGTALLQRLSSPGTIIISHETYQQAGHFFETVPVCPENLSKGGREHPLAHVVLRDKEVPTRFSPTLASKIPLIGRKKELDLLRNEWAKVSKGNCRIVCVHGVCGIGKSRLIYEFVSNEIRSPKNPPVILTCQSRQNHKYTAFYPVAKMIAHYVRLKQQDSRERRQEKLASLVERLGLVEPEVLPVLESIMDKPTESLPSDDIFCTSDSCKKAYRYAEADALKDSTASVIKQILFALAKMNPVVLLLKDIQWADASTRELIDDVLGSFAEQKSAAILAVVSFRGAGLPAAQLLGDSRTGKIHLKPLDEKFTHKLARAVAEEMKFELNKNDLDTIYDESGGLPHIIWEMAGGEDYQISWFNKVLSASEWPEKEHLPITPKCIAQIASMLGHRVSYSDLRAAVLFSIGLEETEPNIRLFEETLGDLLTTELLLEVPLADEQAFCFISNRTQTRFYQSMSPRDRMDLHVKLARMFETSSREVSTESAESIARQYTFACRLARNHLARHKILQCAIYWWQHTATGAMFDLAMPEAAKCLKRCLRLIRKLDGDPDDVKTELQLLLDLANAYEIQSGVSSPEIVQIYKKARKLAKRVNEKSLVFRTQWTYWFFEYLRGNLTRAKVLAEELVKTTAYKELRECQLEAQHAMWDTLFHLGRLREVLAFHLQGINTFRKMPRADRSRGFAGHAASACCLSRGALLLWIEGCIDQSLQMSEDALEEAAELEHSNSLAHVFSLAALLRLLRKEPQEAHENAAKALEYAEKHSIEPRSILCKMLISAGELLSHPCERMIVELRQNLKQWQSIGPRVFETFWLSCIADAYLKSGRANAGLKVIETAHESARNTKEQFYLPEIHRIHGELLAAKSKRNRAAAEKELRTAVECARKSGAKTLELRSITSLCNFFEQFDGTANEKANAGKALAKCFQSFHEGLDTADLIAANAIVNRKQAIQ